MGSHSVARFFISAAHYDDMRFFLFGKYLILVPFAGGERRRNFSRDHRVSKEMINGPRFNCQSKPSSGPVTEEVIKRVGS